MKTVERLLAEKLLKISAIKLQPENPFVWASGWNSPIYTDNRRTLSYPEVRTFIKVELCRVIMENLGEVYVGYDGQPKSTEFGRKSLRLGRKLEPGFVLTIEPGVYFIPELMDLWRSQNKFTEFINYDKLFTYKDFSGIRNEEDYLITENGARLLGKKIPVRAEEVEAIRK